MSDMEHLIGLAASQIAREVAAEYSRDVVEPTTESEWPDVRCYDFSRVLKARLLPVLEAGEEMRRAAQGPATVPIDEQDDEMAHPLFVSLGKWDAAKRKAEGR